jgi:UDP-glucose 4-epimerase
MKNILIIGCLGFIGKAIKSFFETNNSYSVYGVDLATYSSENNYISFTKYGDFDSILNLIKIDICINASGAANVSFSVEHPAQDFNLNSVNVFKILNALRIHSPKAKFINLSSAAVYGNPGSLPIKETSSTQPISPYGYHKYISELICQEFNQLYDVKTCCLRIFSAYGPGLKKQLLWDLSRKAEKQNHILLYGTGEESRDFIYIDDLVHAVQCILEDQHFSDSIINIASGSEVYIKDIARIFFKHYNSSLTYEFSGQRRIGDPDNWRADTTKLQQTGFKQKIDIEEGIQNYIQWVKDLK